MKKLFLPTVLTFLTVISTHTLCFAEKDVDLIDSYSKLFPSSNGLFGEQPLWEQNTASSTDDIYLHPNKAQKLKVEFYTNHDPKVSSWVHQALEEDFLDEDLEKTILNEYLQSTNTYLDFERKNLAKIVRINHPEYCEKDSGKCLTYILKPNEKGEYKEIFFLYVDEMHLATKETKGYIDLIVNPKEYLGGRYEFNGTQYQYVGKN